MIAKCELTVGETSSTIEVEEGDGLLLFYFADGEISPHPLMVGSATAGGFVDAAMIALKIVSDNAHEVIENGPQE